MKKIIGFIVLIALLATGCSKVKIELEPTFKFDGKEIVNTEVGEEVDLLFDLKAFTKGSNLNLLSNVSIQGDIDYNTPGTYDITYVLEYNGQVYTITRKVVVNSYKSSDLELVLNGSSSMKVLYNSEFNDPFVTATNNRTGENITHLVEVEGSVDTSVEGFYTIIYKINYRGVVKTRTRDVQVLEDPGLKLIINNNTTQYNKYILGDEYIEYGVNILDNLTESLISFDMIDVKGNFNTEEVGIYYIEYEVSVRGRTYTVTRTVEVLELINNVSCNIVRNDVNYTYYSCSFTLNDKTKLPEGIKLYAYSDGAVYVAIKNDNGYSLLKGSTILYLEYTYKNITYKYWL